MQSFAHQLSHLFRLVESEMGTKNMTTLVLRAFQQTVQDLKVSNVESFMRQLNELIDTVESIQPRFAMVIDDFYAIWERLDAERKKRTDSEVSWCWKMVEQHIEDIVRKGEKDFKGLVQHGANCIQHNDVILIHSHSNTVLEILRLAHQKRKKFRIVVAEQDIEKTQANIEYLSLHHIPFQVIPSYMLTHIEDTITKLFFGAVTLKNTKEFVMNAGSNAIISEFFLKKTPCYMFLTTQKFSLWHSEVKSHEVHAVKHTKKHSSKEITFERLKFSHDRVPLAYFSHIVTEQGVFDSDSLYVIYQQLFQERMLHEKERGKRS